MVAHIDTARPLPAVQQTLPLQKPPPTQLSPHGRPAHAPAAPHIDVSRRRYLLPPIFPCHYMLQRAGFMGAWVGAHTAILAYFLAANMSTDWTQGLNLATQYGIVVSLMGILLAMSPTFLGLLRQTPLNRIFTFEKRIHAHKFMSYLLFVWTMTHSSLHYWTGVKYADSIQATHLFIFWQDRLGITGQLMWIFFLFIGLAALPVVRRLYYEVFYYIHHLYLVNIVLLYLHSENGLALRYVTGPLAIFAADYLYRAVRSYPLTSSRRARIRYIRFHPNDVVEVGFDRQELLQHTRIGQYVKICVPELGIFQWHPFTITATPEETKIMADGRPRRIWKIHFKVSGDWTYKLSQRLYKVTAGSEAYTNNFDQEARIGRVVNDMGAPEIVPLQCIKDESEEAYIMAIAGRLDSGDSAVVVGPDLTHDEHVGSEDIDGQYVPSRMQQPQPQSQPPLQLQPSLPPQPPLQLQPPLPPQPPLQSQVQPEPEQLVILVPIASGISNDISEVVSPLDSAGTCPVTLAMKKNESDDCSFLGSDNSMDDNTWFVPGLEINQAKLPMILVDGPYNAPVETFFEYHANIVVAAGIGITPYIAALERVLSMCTRNIPVRTTQKTREELLPQRIYLIWVFRDISLLCLMQPALLRLRASARARDIVVPCIYVTGAVDVEHESTASDVFGRPMLQLSNGIRLSKGRPPMARMVSYMAGKHPSSRMGVFCCAPKKLAALVRSSVHDTNAAVAHQGTSMEMRSECFSM